MSNPTGTFSIDTISFTISNLLSDQVIVRMDTSGAALWSSVLINLLDGGTYNSRKKLAISSSGEIFLLYNKASSQLNYVFAGDTIFNPYCPTCNYGAVFKFSSSGTPLWASGAVYSNAPSFMEDFTIDDNDDIITTGYFANEVYYGNLAFDGQGYQNLFAAKVLNNGMYSWFKTDLRNGGQQVYDWASSIVATPGNTYTLAGFRGQGISPTFYLGCNGAPNSGNGSFVANISNAQEPVPQAVFSVMQQGGKIIAVNETTNASSVQWNFGDGQTSSLEQPYHVYSDPGVYNLCLKAFNSCGYGETCQQIVVKGIREIRANKGSNDGIITTEIFGGGFTPATTAKLIKQSGGDIIPIAIQFVNTGKLIARFNLNGQPVVTCDLEVDVPGDTTMSLISAFNIIAGAPYNLDVTAIGQNISRPGRWVAKTIVVQNNSSKDAVGVPLFYRYRNELVSDFVYQPFDDVTQISFTNAGYQYLQSNGLNTAATGHSIVDSSTISVLGAVVIPLLKAGETYQKTIYINSAIQQQFTFGVFGITPLITNSALAGVVGTETDFCFGEFLRRAMEATFAVSINQVNWNSCFLPLQDSIYSTLAGKAINLEQSPAIALNAFLVSAITSIISTNCIPGLPASLNDNQIAGVISKTISNLLFLTDVNNNFNCPQLNQYRVEYNEPLQVMTNEFCDLIQGAVVSPFSSLNKIGALFCQLFSNSSDPNTKQGAGDNINDVYIKPGTLLPYVIAFENLNSATAPASEVFITDTLDISKLDISTFEFGPVTVSDNIYIRFDEPGLEQIAFEPIPATGNSIRVLATLDTITGVATWILSTVFTSDYQPNPDPLQGFLPPNLNGTEGTGTCSYLVKGKNNLVTGDQIDNDAEIVFDNNAPILTPVWTNIVDITPPQSAVNPLPPNINTTQFTVSWSGTDFIAGIRAYKVYVSENDGPYQLLIPFTDTTSIEFNGVNGYKYEFFSIALDKAGNIEDAPLNPETNPDAVTTIITGIQELSAGVSFSLQPNPVDSKLNIYCTEAVDAISVYDMFGKILYKSTDKLQSNNISINTNEFSSGVYFVELSSQGKKGYARFVKN
jgi:hypothetical protein